MDFVPVRLRFRLWFFAIALHPFPLKQDVFSCSALKEDEQRD